MLRTAIVLLAVSATAAAQARFLPRGGSAAAATSDSSGNVFLGGALNNRAYVARLAADGEPRAWFTLDSPASSGIAALAAGPDGSLFAAGSTWDGSAQHAFVVKLDAQGKQEYLATIPGRQTNGMAVAVNARGEALVSGWLYDPDGEFVPTARLFDGDGPGGFLVKLDRAGATRLVAIRGLGYGPVGYDTAGDIYIAGVDFINSGFPATAGAFQSKHDFTICGGSGFFAIPCGHQYIAKLSADGASLRYATFLTGGSGATAEALWVDADGNALVAGMTYSSDYPVTAGAYQTEYRVTSRYPYVPSPHGMAIPPPSTGYLTKLNRDGTGLVWSTFFSGTGSEAITGMAVDTQGTITVAGLAGSRDLPGGQTVPDLCAPGLAVEVPFAAQLSPDGARLVASRFVFGLAARTSPAVALRPDGAPVLVAGETLAAVDMTASTGLACAIDPADFARLVDVAPGSLVSILGDELADATVAVDGVPAGVLYTSREQINVRVPAEVAGRDVVEATVTTANGITLSRPLRIVPRAASAFLDIERVNPASHYASCSGTSYGPADPPIARNEDGSLNSCESPARPGSTITLFLNGLGVDPPAASLKYPSTGTILGLEQDPDSPAGVWRLRIRLPENAFSQSIEPLLDGAPLRNYPLAIWVSR